MCVPPNATEYAFLRIRGQLSEKGLTRGILAASTPWYSSIAPGVTVTTGSFTVNKTRQRPELSGNQVNLEPVEIHLYLFCAA